VIGQFKWRFSSLSGPDFVLIVKSISQWEQNYTSRKKCWSKNLKMMQQDDMDHKGMLIINQKNAMNGSNQSIYRKA